MNVFAKCFSDKLKSEATKHRPLQSALSLAQIGHLSNLAGYEIELNRDRCDSADFIIYHPDGAHGLDNGLHVIWQVRAVGFVCLVYYPTLQPYFYRGPKREVIYEMLNQMTSFLPNLGYQSEYTVYLKEQFVIIPDGLKYISTGINVMYASEFQEKYHDLYQFLKEKIEDQKHK